MKHDQPKIKVTKTMEKITVPEMKRQLSLLGIFTKAIKKDEVWEIYESHSTQLEHYALIERSNAQLWGTKKGLTNLFCKALLVAGKNGLLMKDIAKVDWNPNSQTFYDKCKTLIAEGFVRKEKDRFFVTQKGLENSPC